MNLSCAFAILNYDVLAYTLKGLITFVCCFNKFVPVVQIDLLMDRNFQESGIWLCIPNGDTFQVIDNESNITDHILQKSMYFFR